MRDQHKSDQCHSGRHFRSGRRQADYLYLRKVAAAGGYRNYERNHLNALSGIFVPKFARLLPPEMVRRVVEYAFDVGGH